MVSKYRRIASTDILNLKTITGEIPQNPVPSFSPCTHLCRSMAVTLFKTRRRPWGGESTRGVSPFGRGVRGASPGKFLIYGCLCVRFNAFWRHLHFHNGTLTHRTIDIVSGLRIVMHANSKRFIHTLIKND